jgi:hypothetical protein
MRFAIVRNQGEITSNSMTHVVKDLDVYSIISSDSIWSKSYYFESIF